MTPETYQKQKAAIAIATSAIQERLERLAARNKMLEERADVERGVMCATHGHPPVVETCMGQVTCARCGAILGDTLMGVYDLTEKVLVQHDCEKCHAIWDGLSEEQKRWTKDPFVESLA